MSLVRGKDGIISITGKIVACVRSLSLNVNTTFIETTTAGSGTGTTVKPQKNTTKGSMEGVMHLAEAGKWNVLQLMSAQISHTLFQDVTIVYTDDVTGNTGTITFDFYFSDSSLNSAAGDLSNFSFDFQVNGNPVITQSATGGRIRYMNVDINALVSTTDYQLTWDNEIGGVPTVLDLEISTDDGVTWTPQTFTRTGDEELYYPFSGVSAEDHWIRLTPYYSGLIGTGDDFYYSTDYDDDFTTPVIGATSFDMATGFSVGVEYDVSIDGGATYDPTRTGLTSTTYTVTGLTTATTYQVVRRMHSIDGHIQVLPPVAVTTV